MKIIEIHPYGDDSPIVAYRLLIQLRVFTFGGGVRIAGPI